MHAGVVRIAVGRGAARCLPAPVPWEGRYMCPAGSVFGPCTSGLFFLGVPGHTTPRKNSPESQRPHSDPPLPQFHLLYTLTVQLYSAVCDRRTSGSARAARTVPAWIKHGGGAA